MIRPPIIAAWLDDDISHLTGATHMTLIQCDHTPGNLLAPTLADMVASFQPFTVRIKSAGTLENRNQQPTPVWFVEDNDRLVALRQALLVGVRAAGMNRNQPRFRPHLSMHQNPAASPAFIVGTPVPVDNLTFSNEPFRIRFDLGKKMVTT